MFEIDTNSNSPIYLEIANSIINLILNKTYLPNDKLPSIRVLSQTLSINHNTIKKAYQALEEMGYVYTKSGSGIYVAENIDKLNNRETQKMLDEIENIMVKVKAIGISKKEITALVDKVYLEEN